MFGETSLMMWMASAIVFSIGGGAGFFIARQIKDKRNLELEQQLKATQSQLTEYQGDVNRHFLKTSLLFNKLTDNYKEVYEHLATGAQTLCNEKPLTAALNFPEAKILSTAAITADTRTTTTHEEKPETDTLTSAPPKTEQDDTIHIGAEANVATQESDAANPTENPEIAPAEDTKQLATEQASAEEQSPTEAASTESSATEPNAKLDTKPGTEKTPAVKTTPNTPTITAAELKILDANEKKKNDDDEVHLGAESTPGVDLEHHKTHPSIH